MEMKTVIVIGDGVIDEYWPLSRHRSETSSFTGLSHYRADAQAFRALCGAGHVARVLYASTRNHEERGYQFIGVGNWAANDTNLIKHLVHGGATPQCPANRIVHGIASDMCADDPEVELLSLYEARGVTTRALRTYMEGSQKLEQIERIDFGVNPTESMPTADPPDQLRNIKGDCTIVLDDLNKGVVNEHLVGQLHSTFPKARWYVKTKNSNAKWLASLKGQLDLLLLGPEVSLRLNPWGGWVRNGRPSLQAMETIEKHTGKNIVLLSEDGAMVAKTAAGKCVVASSGDPITLERLAWPSAVFGLWVWQLILGRQWVDTMPLEILTEAEALSRFDGLKSTRDRFTPTVWPAPSWTDESVEWEAARNDMGIIAPGTPEARLDIWRGEACLPGYVCCVNEKREVLERIGRQISTFSNSKSSRRASVSILIQADPGSGKTMLARTLADAFGLRFLRYDLTQMTSRDALSDIFDEIATRQADGEENLLVLVDELNALVGVQPAFGVFLAPLEEGIFVRRNRSFALRPCVWIFAGTMGEGEKPPKSDKQSDFISRMTLHEEIDIASIRKRAKGDTNRVDSQAKLEQVYLGALMIRRYFPEVRRVSKDVLKIFHDLNPSDQPARTIRRTVAGLENVSFGVVRLGNVRAEDIGRRKSVRVEELVTLG